MIAGAMWPRTIPGDGSSTLASWARTMEQGVAEAVVDNLGLESETYGDGSGAQTGPAIASRLSSHHTA